MVIGIVVVVVVVVVCVSGGNANQNRLLSMATNTDKQTQSKWCLGIRKKRRLETKNRKSAAHSLFLVVESILL